MRPDDLPLRILLVGPGLQPIGGQAVQLQRLLVRLRTNKSITAEFEPTNPAFSGPFRYLQRIKYVRTLFTSIVFFARLIVAVSKADVVHVFSAAYWSFLISACPPMLIARILGKHVVLNYRSGEAEDHLQRWRWLAPRLMRLAHRIVVPSGYLVGVFEKHGLRALPILNFVELDKIPYRARSDVQPVFLSNRSLQPLYNVACILRAFQLIQRSHPAAKLIVAGDGPERATLTSLAQSLNLQNVEFRGNLSQNEMWQAYLAADIYLNSPNLDNMPGSILEAFAAGLPVVSTNAGGIPFIVESGATGLLSDVGDYAALAANALLLLSNKTYAAEISVRARQEVETKYTWNVVEQHWLKIYQRPDKSPSQ